MKLFSSSDRIFATSLHQHCINIFEGDVTCLKKKSTKEIQGTCKLYRTVRKRERKEKGKEKDPDSEKYI